MKNGQQPDKKARLDPFDASLLEALQRNNRLTAEALAEEVGLSAAACQKRLRRLRRDGHVGAEIAILDPGLAGQRITLIVQVTLKDECIRQLRDFAERMQDVVEVMQCYRVTGDAHFIIMLTVADMTEYEAFCARHIYEPDNVHRFLTILVKERVKTGFFQPVSPLPVG